MNAFLAGVERRAFRMAQVATGNADEALDIVQDAMLALVRHYRNKPADQWRMLFYRILQNRIRNNAKSSGSVGRIANARGDKAIHRKVFNPGVSRGLVTCGRFFQWYDS